MTVLTAISSLLDGHWTAVAGVMVGALCLQYVLGKRKPPLPPGPKGRFPLLGITFDMPKFHPWVQFARWAETYGPIMHLRVGLQDFIIISSGEIAKEFLDKRSQIYSSRPPSRVGDILTSGMRAVLLPYNHRWRAIRKAFANILTAKKCDTYTAIQAKEAIATIYEISAAPDEYVEKIYRYSLSVARSVAFGKRVQSPHEPFAKQVKAMMEHFAAAMTPGKYLFESIPALQLLPRCLRPWMDELEKAREDEHSFAMANYKIAREEAEKHPDRPCVAHDLKREMEKAGVYNELQCAITCTEILGTGSETTATSLVTMVHALAMSPEVVKKAHEELDRVIGRGRFPSWDDEPNLPYIRAIIKEQHRWSTIAPMSFAHWSDAEDVYKGYRIPKNSVVRVNTWAIHMDPSRYAEPQKFLPERFINHTLSASAYANNGDTAARDHFSYGGGKRICVGLHLAERSLFTITARLLQAFDIKPGLDANGKEMPLDKVPYTSLLISFPEPFPAQFIARNDQIKGLIQQEWTAIYGNGPIDSWSD